MPHQLIVDQTEFENLCREIRAAGLAAFDTEFVSEHTYRPQLCLLQFATRERCAAADPFQLNDLACWWELMADDETTVVVHGGQAEVRFCLTRCGCIPRKLFDVQIAEGLRSRSYPLGYSALVNRVLGKKVHAKETRTDWRRRPLSYEQIDYALDDVRHILDVWQLQRESLTELNRIEWAETEFQRMVDEVRNEASRPLWDRLPGIHKLNRRELAVAQELCQWRNETASKRDQPLRRVLRDDLIVELSRRQPKLMKDLMSTRDMQRSNYKRAAPELLKCIERGLKVPQSKLPQRLAQRSPERKGDEHVIGQLLGLALANRCVEANLARSLVATNADLRQLVRWHVEDDRTGHPPRLATGWRAEVCGDLLEDVLDGKIAIRVADPESDHPLRFERS